jgi:Cell wall-active antibiotics response 4TMS YvqF
MKMAPGFLGGLILILIGLAIIFRIVFDVNLFRIIIATAIILFGVRILLGKNWISNRSKKDRDVIFSDYTYRESPQDKTKYNVMFGKSVYDFTGMHPRMQESIKIKIDVVFGSAIIKINPDMPVKIKSEAVFGGSRMPDGNTVAFGSISYNTDSFKRDTPHFFIESNVVFGGIEVRAK